MRGAAATPRNHALHPLRGPGTVLFEAGQGDPLAGTARDLDARLAALRERPEAPLGRWHRRMMQLVDEVLEEE